MNFTGQELFWRKPAEFDAVDGWLEYVNKPTPKLPQPPDPPAMMPDFTRIDKYALATPVEMTKSIPKLAQYLSKEARNDKEKARAIYTWMIENVAYDYDNYFKPTTQPDLVLQTQRTVCGGYANLFEALAKQSGLPTATIVGVVRKLDDPMRDPRTVRFTDGTLGGLHGWNLTKLDGKLYLVDPTWDHRHNFIKGKIENHVWLRDHFLIPAEAMVYTHIPNDPRMQQLKNPLTKAEHAALPLCEPDFFRYGLKFGSAPQPVMAARNTVLVTLLVPDDVVVSANVSSLGENRDGSLVPSNAFIQARDGFVEIRAVLPRTGPHKLTIFAGKRGGPAGNKSQEDTQTLGNVLQYRVDAQGSKEPQAFPVAYAHSFGTSAYLYHPFTRDLKAQQPQTFAISVPAAAKVFIQSGKKRTPLTKHGDLFVGAATPEAGDVILFAGYPDQSTLPALLKFTAK